MTMMTMMTIDGNGNDDDAVVDDDNDDDDDDDDDDELPRKVNGKVFSRDLYTMHDEPIFLFSSCPHTRSAACMQRCEQS